MKKRWILLISLIMLLGMTTISNAADFSKSYDFENYTTGLPLDWSAWHSGSVKPVQVDEEHGTSMRGQTNSTGTEGGSPAYSLPTVSSGKFLMSLEVRIDDRYKNIRWHVQSPSDSNSQSYSFFMIDKAGNLCSAVTKKGGWEFPILMEYESGRWYQIDILFNFDEKSILYFIDGQLMETAVLNIPDFNMIILRMESTAVPQGETGYVYYDNVTFKYATGGTISSDAEKKPVMAGTDTVTVNFSELVSEDSLDNVKVYDMGSNPISFTPREIEVELSNIAAKKATFKLSEPFQQNKIYKLEIIGAESVFGTEFLNDSIYFASSRSTSLKTPVDVNFSDVTGTDSTNVTSSSINWVPWKWIGTRAAVAVATDAELGENVLKFAPRGTSFGNDPSIEIQRAFDNPFTSELTMECKMKIVKGNQSFIVYDSEGNSIELLSFKDDGIYYGETKIANAILNDWFIVKASFDQMAGTVAFDIDGTPVEAVSYKDGEGVNKILDVKTFAIKQVNAVSGAAVADRAESYYKYYKVQAQMPSVYAKLVTFEDDNGNVYYPDDTIPSDISAINVAFTEAVNPTTLSGVKLKINGVDEPIDAQNSAYDAVTNTYKMVLPEYLLGNSTYTIDVTSDVKSANGDSVVAATGNFATTTAPAKANGLNMVISGGSVSLDAEVVNTNPADDGRAYYLIYAAYENDMMIDLQLAPINLDSSSQRVYTPSTSYSLPQNADDVRVFLWKGMGITPQEMQPLTPLKSEQI